MKKIFVLTTIILMLVSNTFYCLFIVKGLAHPTLITWIIFFLAVGLSFVTYVSSPKHNIWSNICNTIDLVLVFVVTIIIIFWGQNIRFSINIFEIMCILFSFIILIFWRITKSHEVSNVFLQIIMTIAYFPTFYQLYNSSENSESLVYWTIALLAGICGFITGLLGKDNLAMLYSGRSVAMITILLILILRIVL